MKGSNFSMKEINKLVVIQSIIDGKRTGKEAAEVLKISQRQIWRLVSKVKTSGSDGIKHGNSNLKPIHAFSNEFRERIINLKLSDDYSNTNFSHFKDLLEEREEIFISYTALYNILKNAGIISKNKYRDKKTHRRRKRKLHKGDLVQADGTPYDWFDSGIKQSIHGFIDDATGEVLGLYMCEHECLLGYLEVLRQMLLNHGIPKCLYPDRYSVFFPACSQKITLEEQLEGKNIPTTQFMRIVNTLGIHMFPASTSQAKGRIERLWRTIQDRLKEEMKIYKISTIEQANAFFPKFIKKYNKRFAIAPQEEKTHFSDVPDYINLDYLLASKLTRVIDNAGSFTINNVRFQILNNKILPNVKIDIYISKKNGIIVRHNDTDYNVICFNDIPSSYSTHTLTNLFNEYKVNVSSFALSLLSSNAKEEFPLLTSS